MSFDLLSWDFDAANSELITKDIVYDTRERKSECSYPIAGMKLSAYNKP